MTMMKKLLPATLVAAAMFSMSAQAASTTIDLAKGNITKGSFSYTYDFTIASGFTGTIDGLVGSVFRSAAPGPVAGVDITDVSLGALGLTEHDGQVVETMGAASKTTGSYTFSSGILSAGTYTFTVFGKAFSNGAAANLYSGQLNLVTTPVPEPESFGMMGLGLGLIGLLGMRKKK